MNLSTITVRCENEAVLNEVSKFIIHEYTIREPEKIEGDIRINYSVTDFYETMEQISSKYPEYEITIEGTDEIDWNETVHTAMFAGGILLRQQSKHQFLNNQ